MLDKQEIRILYHLIDCIFPDLEKKDYSRYELKPVECREYINKISFSESEHKTLIKLKEKMQGELLGFSLK